MALTSTSRARLRVLLIVVVVFSGLTAFLWTLVRRNDRVTTQTVPSRSANINGSPNPAVVASSGPSPLSTSSPAPLTDTPESEPGLSDANNSLPAGTPSTSFVGELRLIIPVAGVRPEQLLDTFSDARSEGRLHDAIDIPAPAGTPVVAAADGEVVRLFQSDRGGTTIYQLSPDRKLIFYYAHLQRYADGLIAGKFVRQGEVIAYVGDTGNAGVGNYHLHFSVAVVADPKRYWEGTNINPYPLLKK